MNIAYLTNQYGRASDTFIRQEVQQLRSLGHRVCTFSIRRPEAEHTASEDALAAQETTDYILDHGKLVLLVSFLLGALTNPLVCYKALRVAWRTRAPGVKALFLQSAYLVEANYLARQLRKHKIAHVHNHIGMNSATVAMLAAVLADISWSMTVHGPHDFVEPHRWALPQKMEHADFTVFIADFGRSQGMWLTPPTVWHKLHVIRCGLDESFLNHPPTPAPEEAKAIFVGRLSQEKGVLLLLGTIAKLKRDGVPVMLKVIGEGPLRPAMEELIEKEGIGDLVDIVGWKGSSDVRAEILASRVLILPSFAEGLPIVLMEAMALHRVVISTYVAGIPELVIPGENGSLVPPGSFDGLVKSVSEVINLPRAELSERGHRAAMRVALRHNAEINIRQLEALILDAVKSRNGSPVEF